jgi:AraC-like DNA-binding protein
MPVACPASHATARNSLGFAGARRPPHLAIRGHQHQDIELNFIPDGTMTYLLGGQLVTVPAARLAVLWAETPHQVVALSGTADFFWFTLPFAWVIQLGLPPGMIDRLLSGHLLVAQDGNAADERQCVRWLDALRETGDAIRQAVRLELEAALWRMSLAPPAAAAYAGNDTNNRRLPASHLALHIQRMAGVIATGYTGELSISDIVRPTGLNENYAMTLFRQICGMTLRDYVTRHRLSHARRMLATTSEKVITVAMESGFGSMSRFYEAFKKAEGCSPESFRKRQSAMLSGMPRDG